MSNVAIQKVKPGTKGAFTPYGANKDFMVCREPAFFVCGAADCGKTFASCWKMHLFALYYPGCHILMCRKNATALRNSAVKTYQKILKDSHYDKKVKLLGKSQPDRFTYPYARVKDAVTGRIYEGESTIVIGNLDRSSDHLGAEYDLIYVNQPEDITLEDWEYLMTRSSGRAGNAPYSILFGDPNPAHAQHWIKKGYDEGRWKIFAPTHKDNPSLWDHEKEEWTPDGKIRVRALENLTGHRRDRLLKGEWVNTEGLIFGEVWNEQKHTLGLDEMPVGYQHWDQYLTVDWGFDHPFVAALYAHSPDGTLYRHKLIYRTHHDINDNSNLVSRMIDNVENLKGIICDRGGDQQMVMERVIGRGLTTAKKGAGSVNASRELLTKRLVDGTIKFVHVDEALFHDRDPRLEDKKHPTGLQEEIGNYRFHQKGDGTVVKEMDDEIDATYYLVRYLDAGRRSIKILWE